MIYTADYIIKWFKLKSFDPEDMEFLIKHYTRSIKKRVPKADINDILFQEAVLTAIGCKIAKQDKTAIQSPSKVQIGNFTEEQQIDLNDNSICQLAKQALSDLIQDTNKSFGIRTFKRQGASEKKGFYL